MKLRVWFIVYTIVVIVWLLACIGIVLSKYQQSQKDITRLRLNQKEIISQRDDAHSQVLALRLTLDEYEQLISDGEGLRAEQAKTIDKLRVKLSRVQSLNQTIISTSVDTSAVYRQQSFPQDTLTLLAINQENVIPGYAAAGQIEWSDPWVSVRVRVAQDATARVEVSSRDTLLQVIHRVPKRFLFIRYGTKGIRQEVVSKNPHSKIVYSEYIEIIKK